MPFVVIFGIDVRSVRQEEPNHIRIMELRSLGLCAECKENHTWKQEEGANITHANLSFGWDLPEATKGPSLFPEEILDGHFYPSYFPPYRRNSSATSLWPFFTAS